MDEYLVCAKSITSDEIDDYWRMVAYIQDAVNTAMDDDSSLWACYDTIDHFQADRHWLKLASAMYLHNWHTAHPEA